MHVQLIRFIIQRNQHNTVSYEYNNYIIGCSYTPTLHLILRFIIQRMDEDKSTWHCMCTHFRFFFLIATWSGVSPFLFNMLSITNMLCLSVWPSVLPKHLKGNTTCTKRCTMITVGSDYQLAMCFGDYFKYLTELPWTIQNFPVQQLCVLEYCHRFHQSA